ncbi:hypothetical protein GE061_018561 [Apolygus lucorum]|uniref:Uncharacterized protein n=1 Tax=Apolygus lucorum TaxID=248454 RepID=A0A8S9XE40_APOLU|nr:hypothetical protein GE061_018561 [Apolygus lucorum]
MESAGFSPTERNVHGKITKTTRTEEPWARNRTDLYAGVRSEKFCASQVSPFIKRDRYNCGARYPPLRVSVRRVRVREQDLRRGAGIEDCKESRPNNGLDPDPPLGRNFAGVFPLILVSIFRGVFPLLYVCKALRSPGVSS